VFQGDAVSNIDGRRKQILGGQSKRRIATWRADRDCRRKPNMSKISDRLMIVRRLALKAL